MFSRFANALGGDGTGLSARVLNTDGDGRDDDDSDDDKKKQQQPGDDGDEDPDSEDDDKKKKDKKNKKTTKKKDAKKEKKKTATVTAADALAEADDDNDLERGRSPSKRLSKTLGRGRSTAAAASSQQQVVVDIMGSQVGGLGRRVVQGDEEDEVSPDDMRATLRKQGANEVADLATQAGSSVQLLALDLRNEYRKPVREIAVEYRRRFHPTDREGNPLSVLHTPTGRFKLPRRRGGPKTVDSTAPATDLLRFGAGISSYFKWLKLLGVMFLTLLVLQLLTIVFNAQAGDYFKRASFGPIVTTLGNLYREPPTNLTLADVVDEYELVMPPACVDGRCTLDREATLFYYGLMDAITTLVFLFFICMSGYFIRREQRRFGKKVLKIEHYSIQVEKVPEDCTADRLKRHFEKIVQGPVHDVQLVQASGNAIALCVKRGSLLKQLARLDATKRYLEKNSASLQKREQAAKKYDKLYQRIVELDEEAARRAEQGAALFAFVTFELQRDRERCLKLYNAFSCAWHQDMHLRLENEFEIKVSEAPPPSTLLWENNEVSSVSRWGRSFVTTLMLALLLLVTVSINYATEPFKISKSFADAVVGADDYTVACGGFFATEDTWEGALAVAQDGTISAQFQVAEDSTDSLLTCLCDVTLAGLQFPNGTEPAGTFSGDGPCADYLADRSKEVGVQLSVSFATLLMNTVLFLLLTSTAFFQRYTSVVQREMTILRRLFVTMYINTGLLVAIVNADLETIFDVNFKGGAEDLFGNGSFEDFSAEWFRVVGTEIMLFALLNIFAPHAFPLLLAVINTAYRELHTPVSQSQQNEAFLGPDFVLSYRYAQVMTMTFLIMTYSTGIPLLFAIGVVFVPVTYWVDKYFFMRVSRTPAEFSGTMGLWANHTLQWAAAVHLLVGSWMLSSPYIFPRSEGDLALGALATLSGVSGEKDDGALLGGLGANATNAEALSRADAFVLDVQVRFFSNQCVPNMMVLLAFLAFKILQNFEVFMFVLRRALRKLAEVAQYLFRSSALDDLLEADENDDEDQLSFEQALDTNAITGIRSYFILANPKYAHAFQQDQQTDADADREHSLLDVLRKRATDGSGLSMAFSISGFSRRSSGTSRSS